LINPRSKCTFTINGQEVAKKRRGLKGSKIRKVTTAEGGIKCLFIPIGRASIHGYPDCEFSIKYVKNFSWTDGLLKKRKKEKFLWVGRLRNQWSMQ